MFQTPEERPRHKIKQLLRDIGTLIGLANDDNQRQNLRRLYAQLKDIELSVDLMKEDLMEMYLRNGAFPGDMVGWLDDDFTYTDDDEDQSDEPKENPGKKP